MLLPAKNLFLTLMVTRLEIQAPGTGCKACTTGPDQYFQALLIAATLFFNMSSHTELGNSSSEPGLSTRVSGHIWNILMPGCTSDPHVIFIDCIWAPDLDIHQLCHWVILPCHQGWKLLQQVISELLYRNEITFHSGYEGGIANAETSESNFEAGLEFP